MELREYVQILPKMVWKKHNIGGILAWKNEGALILRSERNQDVTQSESGRSGSAFERSRYKKLLTQILMYFVNKIAARLGFEM